MLKKVKQFLSNVNCLGLFQRQFDVSYIKAVDILPRTMSDTVNGRSSENLHRVARTGFVESSLYNRVRPSYTRESVGYLMKNLGILDASSPTFETRKTILELGAGTGKFTGVMVDVLRENGIDESKVRIIATEPLASMREKFCEVYPGIEMIQCSAEKIDLQSSTVNAVIAAQSFHWFANLKSLKEIHRVLAPEGHFAIFWYRRDRSTSWVAEIDKLIDKFYERDNVPLQWQINWKKEILDFGKFGPINSNCSFCWTQEGDVEFFVDRFMSVSPVQSSTNEEKEMIVKHIRDILSEEQRKTGKDIFVLPYTTEIYWLKKC